MRQKTYSDEQIIKMLKDEQQGRDMQNIIREMGISERTFYRWKSKYGGMCLQDIRKLNVLEQENKRLKTLVADLTLKNVFLEEELDRAYDNFRKT